MKKEVFGTKEWATHSANVTIGCSHNCTYCYSRDAYRKYDKSGIDWEIERIDETALNKTYTKKEGTIMFPTKHDITENNVEACITVLKKMLDAGNDLLIVSKPNPKVIKRLVSELKEYKSQILFRFTIGSRNNDILKFWEPGASSFEDRLKSLKIAFDNGFNTSVSMEPLLDNNPEDTKVLVSELRPYVTDSIWIGKMNKPEIRLDTITPFIEEYLERQSDENILTIYGMFKDDDKIKWKESIKKVVGIEVPTIAGMDI